MSDSEQTESPLDWLNGLLNSLNRIGVSLEVIGDDIADLLQLSGAYELNFGANRKFCGMTEKLGRKTLLPSDGSSACLAVSTACRMLPENVQHLWESVRASELALGSMPSWASDALNAVGQNWRAKLLRECLDGVLLWPDETLHNLGAKKICSDPSTLLGYAMEYDPRDDWKAKKAELDKYRADLIAIRYEAPSEATESTGEAPSPFPYAADTSLHNLWGWGHRIQERLYSENFSPSKHDWMIFRPSASADAAMLALGIDYPTLVAEIRDKLASANEAFDGFLANNTESTREIFVDRIRVLSVSILVSCKLISQGKPKATDNDSTGGKAEALDKPKHSTVSGKAQVRKKPTVNDRMKAELAANMETVKGWTAQQWATHLNCGKTTVVETETWKNLSFLRQQAKAEKRKDRRGTKPL